MKKFKEYSANHKRNAQANLSGLSHYVDNETLKFFNARVVESKVSYCGLYFILIETKSADYENKTRCKRATVFNIMGKILHQTECKSTNNKNHKIISEAYEFIDNYESENDYFKDIKEALESANKMQIDALNQLEKESKQCL